MKRTSLFLTLMLALTGLVAATGAAHADTFTGPTSVQVGTQYDYTVTVTTPGILDLHVGLSGSQATFIGVSNDPGVSCSFSNFEATCSPVGNGPAGSFQITLTVLPTQAGLVMAELLMGFSDESNFIETLGTTITEPPAADLEVTLDASSSILLTSRVVYTAHAFNNGPATSPGSTVTTHLSSAALSVNAGSGCTLSSGHHDVTCPVGSLASGSGANATFTVTFPLLTIGLNLNATATIAGTGPTDPTSGNNTDGAACLAVTPVLIVCP